MISVRNHLLQLSGNKWSFFIGIVLLSAGCSPKVQPVATTVRKEAPSAKKEPAKASETLAAARVSTIAMLLPFDLDYLNPGQQYTPSTLSRATLSLDFYQGFKLALDSLSS